MCEVELKRYGGGKAYYNEWNLLVLSILFVRSAFESNVLINLAVHMNAGLGEMSVHDARMVPTPMVSTKERKQSINLG